MPQDHNTQEFDEFAQENVTSEINEELADSELEKAAGGMITHELGHCIGYVPRKRSRES